jgi:MFS family permease
MNRLSEIYHEFPRKFWVVVGVMFIDRIGGTLLFPFFSLYITQKFQVGMTEAGVILGLFSIFGLVGQMIGGALTDKFGRRKLILFGLVFSALSTLTLGLVNNYATLIPLAMLIGILSDIAGPAHQAMMADILPEEKRQEGFGLMRVIANLSWIIGPTIGGFVAGRSFLALFIIDAVISCAVAVLFYFLISETKPEPHPGQKPASVFETFKGYAEVFKDKAYVAFVLVLVSMGLVYGQMYNSLSVYLRDVHQINTQGYGFLMSTSAITVILFQFWVSRRIKHSPPFLIMAFGAVFYVIGFGMFGFVSAFWMFMSAIVIITIGEMLVSPTMQTLTANFAPEVMRGRYMAVFGFAWMLPSAIGPGAAGLILDNFNPNLLWYIGAGLCTVSVLGFLFLHLRLGKQTRFAPAPEVGIEE